MWAPAVRLGTTFRVGEQLDLVRARVDAYVRNAGYRPGGADRYVRGGKAFVMFAISPRRWHTTVAVTYTTIGAEVEIATRFEINVTGQSPSRWENRFWLEEVMGVEAAVRTGDVSASRNRELAGRALRTNLGLVPVLGTTLVGPTFAVVAIADALYWGKTAFVLVALAALGASLGVTVWIARRIGLFEQPDMLPYLAEESRMPNTIAETPASPPKAR